MRHSQNEIPFSWNFVDEVFIMGHRTWSGNDDDKISCSGDYDHAFIISTISVLATAVLMDV